MIIAIISGLFYIDTKGINEVITFSLQKACTDFWGEGFIPPINNNESLVINKNMWDKSHAPASKTDHIFISLV